MRELKAGSFQPVYLLMGEEPYYIDQVSDYIENHALTEADKVFNQTIFYGKDSSAVDIVHEAEQYPMMAERRLVIVKEAQELDKLSTLEAYVEHIQPSTIMVICHKYKSVDKRLKLVKLIEKAGVVMETKKLYDYQMPSWIMQYASQHGMPTEQRAAEMMAEALGTNISAIVSAFEKLKVAENGEVKLVTPDMVTRNIGISKEYNTFELRDALFAHNTAKVNKIVKVFSLNEKQNPIQPIVAMLFTSFEKLFAYHYLPDKDPNVAAAKLGEKPFVINRLYKTGCAHYNARKCMEIIELLRTYDMRSKGYAWPACTSGQLLTELVFRILNR